jgi:transcriptional regulator with XRE-family HTH domain
MNLSRESNKTNPFRLIRDQLGITQKTMSERSGVTIQVVTNLECGLYHKPPIAITTYLESIDPDNTMLELDYYKWVKDTRSDNSELFQSYLTPNIMESPDSYNGWSWLSFRLTITPSFRGFCRLLVYQPSMLQEYEAIGNNRGAVNRALSGVGVPQPIRTKLLRYGEPK